MAGMMAGGGQVNTCAIREGAERKVRSRCVVRDSNSGHQLLLSPANWCPIFASRTTQATAATCSGSAVARPRHCPRPTACCWRARLHGRAAERQGLPCPAAVSVRRANRSGAPCVQLFEQELVDLVAGPDAYRDLPRLLEGVAAAGGGLAGGKMMNVGRRLGQHSRFTAAVTRCPLAAGLCRCLAGAAFHGRNLRRDRADSPAGPPPARRRRPPPAAAAPFLAWRWATCPLPISHFWTSALSRTSSRIMLNVPPPHQPGPLCRLCAVLCRAKGQLGRRSSQSCVAATTCAPTASSPGPAGGSAPATTPPYWTRSAGYERPTRPSARSHCSDRTSTPTTTSPRPVWVRLGLARRPTPRPTLVSRTPTNGGTARAYGSHSCWPGWPRPLGRNAGSGSPPLTRRTSRRPSLVTHPLLL